jgi:uncharacterized damage-inducible protein DinB
MNFERLFAYDDWANREEVRHLRSLAAPPTHALKIFAHIVGTEWLWIDRLRNERQRAAVWPDWNLDRCAEELARLYHEWKSVLPVADLHAVINYVNSKGEHWNSRTEDVLMHVVIHGGYHRGQIATLVRASGETPAYTDYIHCIRSGFID